MSFEGWARTAMTGNALASCNIPKLRPWHRILRVITAGEDYRMKRNCCSFLFTPRDKQSILALAHETIVSPV